MELHDALIPFKPKNSSRLAGTASNSTALRVDVLTHDDELMSRIDEALCLLRAKVEPVKKIDAARDRMQRGDVDLTIVHVHHADAWPGIAFKLFDNERTNHPILILCGDAEEARHYQELAEHVIDILPEGAVRDYRFRFLIQAAMLRAEMSSPGQPEDRLPPAA